MNTKELLIFLSNMTGVSGNEDSVVSELSEFLKTKISDKDRCYVSGGNVIANCGVRQEGKPHVLIDAHIDEIGMIVTYIDDDGFVVPGNIGGMDYRLLPAQKVIIHGTKKIPGVVCAVPPHLSDGSDHTDGIDDLRIDTGYTKYEAEKLIPPGSTISFCCGARALMKDRITGKSLDNRAGAAAVIKMLEILKNDNDLNCSFSVLFSCAEEIGQRGAKTACFEINPDIAVAVDVSFALTPDDSKKHCGIIAGGPMIGISPSLSREISDVFINVAKTKNIPFQTEIMSGLTGTNADQFSICRQGVKSCTCSVPLRYMHTPVEVVDVIDIENTALLLAEFIRVVK